MSLSLPAWARAALTLYRVAQARYDHSHVGGHPLLLYTFEVSESECFKHHRAVFFSLDKVPGFKREFSIDDPTYGILDPLTSVAFFYFLFLTVYDFRESPA